MFSKFFKKNKNVLDSRNKNDLLHNVYVLYVVFIVAFLDIFYILQIGDFYSASIFVAVGLLISLISKNMIVILCIAMTVTHIVTFGGSSIKKEGFETDAEAFETDADAQAFEMVESREEFEPNQESSELSHDASELNHEVNHEEPSEVNHEEHEEPSEEEPENSDIHLEKENKKEKKDLSENKVKELIEKQNVILDKLKTMKPFISTMQNWFGGSNSKNTSNHELNEESNHEMMN